MEIKDNNNRAMPILPSFGSTASFSSLTDSVKYGDNHSQRSLKGINGLSMSMNLNFSELTDVESQSLISFLQSHFYYQPQIYSPDGSFSNKRINPFDYQPFYPYKSNKFFCLDFSHDKSYFNINEVSVSLIDASCSILNSVESGAGHNPNIDSLINFVPGAGTSSVQNLNVNLPEGSLIYHSGDYRVAKINSDTSVVAGNSVNFNYTADFGFPASTASSNQTPLRNSIYINNPNDCFYYPYQPITDLGTLDHRMFDFRPSDSINLRNSPKHRVSDASDFYKKYHKYGFNPNLMNLNLSFNGRSDLEAKRILLFLESHLGYKKFGFNVSRDYTSSNYDPRKTLSSFYCPEWKHSYTYKDNHSISATFIECIDY